MILLLEISWFMHTLAHVVISNVLVIGCAIYSGGMWSKRVDTRAGLQHRFLDIIQSGFSCHLMSRWMTHTLTCLLWRGGLFVGIKTPIRLASENRHRGCLRVQFHIIPDFITSITYNHSCYFNWEISYWVFITCVLLCPTNRWLCLGSPLQVNHKLCDCQTLCWPSTF